MDRLQGISCSGRMSPRLPRADMCTGLRAAFAPKPSGAFTHLPNKKKVQLYGTKVKVSFMDVSSISPSEMLLASNERDLLHLENDDSTISKAQLLQEVNSLRRQLRSTIRDRNRLASVAEQAQNSLEKLQSDASVIAHWEKVHLWGQYADARKRILALMDEKEILEIKLSREKTESRCQIRHRLEAEKKLHEATRLNKALTAQLNSMQLSAAS